MGSLVAPTQMSAGYPRGEQRSDPRYLLDSMTHKQGVTTLATIGYPSRDDAGNPLSMTDPTGTWTYHYDANNRLDNATPPNPVPGQPAGGPYDYDWVGNRIHPPAEPNPMTYNAADQLLTWPGMHTYAYYPDGSLQYEKNADGSEVMKSYTYTPDGLLDEAEFDFYVSVLDSASVRRSSVRTDASWARFSPRRRCPSVSTGCCTRTRRSYRGGTPGRFSIDWFDE